MDLTNELNFYGEKRIPFFFIINYDKTKWEIIPLNKLPNNIKYEINHKNTLKHNIKLEKEFIPLNIYKNKFDKVIQNIKKGNTYLFNLTFSTTIKNNLNLNTIFQNSNAKYKLLYKDKFVSFSPETFVTIKNNTINTFPMKGTIDTNIKNAKDILLNDKKELAEHTMIVDLLRNDLNIVSSNVKVKDFRYCETIKAGETNLIQTSSHIQGELNTNWHNNIGNIIIPLLPAGSISGTPKKKTIELIDKIELHKRDYFTGIWGIYDGKTLNSAILIRFIEKQNNNFIYKSGGGITIDSDLEKEYQEMKDKVYIP